MIVRKRIILVSAIAITFLICYYVLDYPLRKRYSRYLTYATMDSLIGCESNNVSRILHFVTNGQERTFVIMNYCCVSPSGPAIFVFDESGVRIDSTRDFGNDRRFERTWRPMMRMAERRRNQAEGSDREMEGWEMEGSGTPQWWGSSGGVRE